MTMLDFFLPPTNRRPFRGISSSVSQGDDRHKVHNHGHLLCYLLHIFLIVIQLILVVAACYHPEHGIVMPSASAALTIGLSGGLQAFYTLYTTLLVFITQRLILSTVFAGPTKLTQIHDICGAWCGLGTVLSALWQQTKVTSSIFSITLVTVYFISISVLHVASSTVMQFQPFNASVTKTASALATWPNPISEFTSSEWVYAALSIVPYMDNLYGNTTQGLANNTLYDVPVPSFLNATINTTMVSSHCGLLTNLSFDDVVGSINVSMTDLGPLSFSYLDRPLPNNIWFIFPDGSSRSFITYLVSTAIEADESVSGSSHVYINGTFSPPGGVAQNFSTQTYLVACSFDMTTTTAALGSSSVLLVADEQPMSTTWPIFSPGGDADFTYAILSAMVDGTDGLPNSPYCQLVMSDPYQQNLSTFDAYMISSFGINVSSCDGTPSVEQHTGTPYLLTRDKMENVTLKIAAQFVWIAGQLGEAGGGFDRQTEDSKITEYVLQWRLNINILPVISSLCASVALYTIVVGMLWGQNSQKALIHATGPLEIMWFGSRSVALHDYMWGIHNPSVDGLRISSIFKTTLWTQPLIVHAAQKDSRGDLYAAVPFHDFARHGTLETSFKDKHVENLQLDLHTGPGQPCIGDTSRSRRWCYALHFALVVMHIVLLSLLVRHPEHLVIIAFETTTLATGLSALLQAIYTLYSALLVFVLQYLAFYKMVGERRKLTAVHDVSGAWTGIGTAALVLWKQRKLASSPWEVLIVFIYLTSMLVLHITSSSIMQWQPFENSLHIGVLQSNLALPDSAVNISSQLQWPQISLIGCSTGQDSNLSTYGLSSSTIYDIPQVPEDVTVSEAVVNATTFNVECGLVPNLTLLSDQFDYSAGVGQYQIGFSSNGSANNTLLAPIWIDFLHRVNGQPQTLFYEITTVIDVDESVHDSVALNLNWTYVSSQGSNPQNLSIVTYIVGCSVSTHTTLATLNLENQTLVSPPNETDPATRTSWPVWSPVAATNLNVGMVTALSQSYMTIDSSYPYGNSSVVYYTTMDEYMMTLLGWNSTALVDAASAQSSADPSVTLTPAQLENVISQTAARFMWVAGQLGESNGGFDRIVGQSPATQRLLQWRLNVNMIPVAFASAASFVALATAIAILGRNPIQGRPSSVSGTTVLESLWLEANSEALHSRLLAVDEPDSDKLREAGMFDIRLGDIQARHVLRVSESEEVTLNENQEDDAGLLMADGLESW